MLSLALIFGAVLKCVHPGSILVDPAMLSALVDTAHQEQPAISSLEDMIPSDAHEAPLNKVAAAGHLEKINRHFLIRCPVAMKVSVVARDFVGQQSFKTREKRFFEVPLKIKQIPLITVIHNPFLEKILYKLLFSRFSLRGRLCCKGRLMACASFPELR